MSKSIFLVATMICGSLSSSHELHQYISARGASITIDTERRVIVLEDAIYDYEMCGTRCIHSTILTISVDQPNQISKESAGLELIKTKTYHSYNGVRCRIYRIVSEGNSGTDLCFSNKHGVLAFRVDGLEDGDWFVSKAPLGLFGKPGRR